MNGDNDVSDLFGKPIVCASNSTATLKSFLEEFGHRRLVYPGNVSSYIGYMFRGEIEFDVPLQPSLERRWFEVSQGRTEFTIDELLAFEKDETERFVQEGRQIRDSLMKQGDLPPGRLQDQNVFEWLQLKQHYQTNTRLLDFTKEIDCALYFALEHFCKKSNKIYWKKGLLLYCFPCVHFESSETGGGNKSPFNDGQPDMNLALGGQMGLECMKPHTMTYERRYCRAKQKQSFGWDCAYYSNPRLKFQEGMLAYPYRTEGVTIRRGGPSWLVQCLRMDQSDPFHLGSTRKHLRAVMIRIPRESVGHCLKYIQDRGLTPPRVYLDYGRIGDRLQLEES